MKILEKIGSEDLSYVYVAEIRPGHLIEFVESIQPPFKREEKWVFIISTLLGCPVKCPMCDAGDFYKGRLTKEEMLQQIDFMVDQRYPDRKISVSKFKIQFCRMGEPSFNPHVLEALEELPFRYQAPGLKPSISSVAPRGSEHFFERLREIKNRLYPQGHFQLQFSIHTTDVSHRNKIIPVKKWDFREIADYGKYFYAPGDQKVSLNFALAKDSPLEGKELNRYFDPEFFLIKLTPINPTVRAKENGMESFITPTSQEEVSQKVEDLRKCGYDVILNIGYWEENEVGSNCGQYVLRSIDASVFREKEIALEGKEK